VDRLEAGDPGQVGPFRLVGRLGEGGMGRVFLGQSRGGRKVAVKVVHPAHARDPEFHRRFAREVAAARQVGGFHTAVVVAADPDADPPWMATAYIAGPSLAEAVAECGPLDEAGARELGAALAEGLAAIHDCGLIHRDLKPSNVILADDGPRIIDFGIAKSAEGTELTNSGVVIGTLRYMSPEQLQGHQLTPQSDVFALGTVLAFAAAGHDPFQGPTIPSVITCILTGPPDLDPLTGDLRRIIGDCLAKAPGDRPSPGDLLARFGHPVPTVSPGTPVPANGGGPADTAPGLSLAGTVDVAPAGRTAPKPAGRRLPHRTGLIAAGAAVVVGLAVAGILGLTDRSPSGPPTVLTDPGSGTVQSVAFGPGGVLAAGDGGGSAYLWNTATASITATLYAPATRGFDSVAFGPGSIVAGATGNGSTYLLRPKPG
jgi:predicted Ser/Thr protein kinase